MAQKYRQRHGGNLFATPLQYWRKMLRQFHCQPTFTGVSQKSKYGRRLLPAAQHIRRPRISRSKRAWVVETEQPARQYTEGNGAQLIGQQDENRQRHVISAIFANRIESLC